MTHFISIIFRPWRDRLSGQCDRNWSKDPSICPWSKGESRWFLGRQRRNHDQRHTFKSEKETNTLLENETNKYGECHHAILDSTRRYYHSACRLFIPIRLSLGAVNIFKMVACGLTGRSSQLRICRLSKTCLTTFPISTTKSRPLSTWANTPGYRTSRVPLPRMTAVSRPKRPSPGMHP